ncbi:MAG: hypothetical protein J5857_00350 [Treponema sp.]|nr:hypothetical protein [Treponema sp.]
MKKFLVIFTVLSLLFSSQLFAEDTKSTEPEPYEKSEFPEWLLNLRRSEIVTLGSVPFTTLAVSLTYSTIQYATGKTTSFPSPFNKNAAYTQDDMKIIVGVSLGVSLVIGIVDFIITMVKHKNQVKIQQRAIQESNNITIIPTNNFSPQDNLPDDEEQEQGMEKE